ncbi:MAG: Immunity protein 8 [Actinomycetia bacterium]|nr:Immunity protein 8 [Actinomycetes bacterium]
MIGKLAEISLSTRDPVFWIGAPHAFEPEDPTAFQVEGSVFMGCQGDPRSVMFDFVCLTPTRLASHGWPDGFGHGDRTILSGRGLILMHSWDPRLLDRHIRGIVEVEGEHLDAIIDQIRLQLICEDE